MTTRNMTKLSVVTIAAIAAIGLAVLLAATSSQTAYADHNSAYKATENASPNACKQPEKNPNCVILEDGGEIGTDALSAAPFLAPTTVYA